MESKTSYADSAICKTLEELRQEVRRALATKADLERRAGSLSASIDAMRTFLLRWMVALFVPFYVGMIVFLLKQFI